jgi:hypothetical protein
MSQDWAAEEGKVSIISFSVFLQPIGRLSMQVKWGSLMTAPQGWG